MVDNSVDLRKTTSLCAIVVTLTISDELSPLDWIEFWMELGFQDCQPKNGKVHLRQRTRAFLNLHLFPPHTGSWIKSQQIFFWSNIARIANAVQCHSLLSGHYDWNVLRFSIVRNVDNFTTNNTANHIGVWHLNADNFSRIAIWGCSLNVFKIL